MRKNVKFQMENAVEIPHWTDTYPEHKFAVYKCCFLSTKQNAHELNISDDVLRKYANTILGNFLVAKVRFGDAMSHEHDEIIYGYFPIEQNIEFVEDKNVTKAYAYAVVSKKYGKDFNDIFEFDNLRNSSVEMTVDTEDDDEHEVVAFDIFGLTCLGKKINGSCPDADIQMVRFSAEEADAYFASATNAVSNLTKFVEERKQSMAENKSYKIDKSKEAMSKKAWGEIDKADLRNKIMEASNRATLVKAVYMLVEDGWEEAPSEHLKYPVMCFEGDTLVYNRDGLASALGYAKKENETAVVNKVEKIYKKLDLESDGKEEKMEEVKDVEMTEAIDESAVEMAEPEKEQVEEKEEKSEEMAEEKCEKAECAEDAVEMTAEEMKAKIAELEKSVEERDHIIMDKDGELEELRAFQNSVYEKERAKTVESVMSDIKEYVDALTFNDLREEGLACNFSELDGWANKAKALCFGAVKKSRQKANLDTTVWSFAAPVEPVKKNTSIWD